MSDSDFKSKVEHEGKRAATKPYTGYGEEQRSAADKVTRMIWNRRIPAVVVAGTHSGCGKTTVTLGLMAALAARGLKVAPFKCGPDFIDPTLHQLVTGRVSRNLDPWMAGVGFTRQTFARHAGAADVAMVEGVMGMFDGGEASSAALSRLLGLPLVLVVDVSSAAESVAAVVRGFEELDPEARPAGVILNRVGSERHLALVTTAIRRHCRAEILGHLPRQVEFKLPSRHLGLHMGGEEPIGRESLARLAKEVSRRIDLDRMLSLGGVEVNAGVGESGVAAGVRIAVARDEAFCFYYEDNLDALRQAGAELVFFSPLRDRDLPAGIGGVYLGGGYPELHAAALAANLAMREAVRRWSEAGRPLFAECGGFMYLTEGIVGVDGDFFPMAGIFPTVARMREKRAALGYRQAEFAAGCLLGPAGTTLRGHEFHYSEIDPMPATVDRVFRLGDGGGEGYLRRRTLASYLHLYFGQAPEVAVSLVAACGKGWEEAS